MLAYIIDDDEIFAECLARYLPEDFEVRKFRNVIEAISAMDEEMPDIVFLDVLLDGPDGFTLLNEMASYSDTAKVPIAIVSSLEIADSAELKDYGVIKVLNKAEMTPESVKECLELM